MPPIFILCWFFTAKETKERDEKKEKNQNIKIQNNFSEKMSKLISKN